MNNKMITIGALVAALLIILFLLIQSSRQDDFQPEVEFEVNELTGEITRTTNNIPEQAGPESIVIYGLSPLSDSLSFVQIDIFRQSTFSHLGGLYDGSVSFVTIIPESVAFQYPNEREEIITFSMVINDSDDTMDVTIRTLGLTGLEIEYDDKDPSTPTFKTGPIINSVETDFEYTGDGIPPEDR